MSQLAVELLAAYHRQRQLAHEQADRNHLLQAKLILEQSLYQNAIWTFENVNLAYEVNFWLGDNAATIEIFRAYLKRSLPIPIEAWTRWHLADHLAMTKRCFEAVEQQKTNLEWTRQILPQPDWILSTNWPFPEKIYPDRVALTADEVLLIRMMSDGTQALCWQAIGVFDKWMQIFHDLVKETVPTSRNRGDRRYYLRTASMLCNKQQDADAALKIAEQLMALSMEDEAWKEAFEVRIDAAALQIEAYHLKAEYEALHQIAESSIEQLNQHLLKIHSANEIAIAEMLLHNLAYALYQVKEYELAIPLFKKSIELGNQTPYAHLWLAASLWATAKNLDEVLPLLKKVASLQREKQNPLHLIREFKDFADNDSFADVFN